MYEQLFMLMEKNLHDTSGLVSGVFSISIIRGEYKTATQIVCTLPNISSVHEFKRPFLNQTPELFGLLQIE